MRITPGRSAAAALILGLSSAAAIGVATPAVAAASDVVSDPVVWEGVDDTTGVIDDAHFAYPGGMPGWTHDAFDGIGRAAVSDCSGGTGSVPLVFTLTAPATVATGGVSVFSLTSTGTVDAVNCDPFTVTLTLTLEGSFARWDYTLSGDFSRFDFGAALGADSDGVYTAVDPSTVLVSDGSQFSPSVILQAQTATSGTWTRLDNINLSYSTSGSPATASFVTAVADYTWITGRADADASLLSMAGSLFTGSFGQSLPLFHGSDAPDFTVPALEAGATTSTVASYSYDGELFRGIDYFDNTATEHTVQASLGTMPPGLSGTVSYAPGTGAPVITISGTPSTVGVYAVPVTFYQLEDDGAFAKPLFASMAITVQAGATAQLADSGFEGAPLLVSGTGALLVGLFVTLLTGRWQPRRKACIS